ncbi:MAG: glycosyltransferase [Plectolyngbya sp. WJT66-NPBG17]|jgi:glycosyltransferase involved in cell wall biosynthesis|nr:glycosyltransferase [Plectolyngbya sp. WJT66-NPBG17]
MNVIQTSAWFPPDSFGGVEVYLDGLVNDLSAIGLNCKVAAARSQNQPTIEQYNQTEVYRYPTEDLKAFRNWLIENRCEIYHQHTLRSGCGLPHLQSAKQLGMKTIVTIHMPDVACLRGTMMQGGNSACDGKIEIARCSACLGVSKRVPIWASEVLSRLPSSIAVPMRDLLRHASDVRLRQLGTTIATPAQVRNQRRQFDQMVELSDRIVVVCQWLYDAFVLNGVPESKLVLSRHGVSTSVKPIARSPNSPIRIGFLGRWQETKGVQILAQALQQIPNAPVELVIHATHADQHSAANRESVLAIAKTDSRIQINPPLARSEITNALAQFDLLAVPSQWLETGPLVVLESLAAGTSVIGSNLGGISELVRHGIDGWLVPARDVKSWANAIAHLSENPDTIEQLKQGIQPVKTRQAVAAEMLQLYRSLIGEY